MKKIIKVFTLVLGILLITGCMNYSFKTAINDDKSVDIEMSMDINLFEFAQTIFSDDDLRLLYYETLFGSVCSANCSMYNEGTNDYITCTDECLSSLGNIEVPTDDELKSYLDEYLNSDEFNEEELFSDENVQELEAKGYTVATNLDKENYLYEVTISQNFASIDDIYSTSAESINLEEIFNGQADNVFFLKTANDTYRANYIWEITEEGTSMQGMDISEFITINYEVTLPNPAINNNATNVSDDAKTLIWNLNSNNTIDYEFSFISDEENNESTTLIEEDNKSSNDTLKIIAICLIAFGSIGIIVMLILLYKNRGQ